MRDPTVAIEARSALHGLALPGREGLVRVAATSPSARFAYRGDPRIIGDQFGTLLPVEPCRATTAGERAALWLGPDEWLLLVSFADRAQVMQDLKRAIAGKPASMVDVSHRNGALSIAGTAAATLLEAGCPLDLDSAAFPVGMCTRTLYAKAEIVLWRTAAETFHVELWRSYAPYFVAHLAAAIGDVDQCPGSGARHHPAAGGGLSGGIE